MSFLTPIIGAVASSALGMLSGNLGSELTTGAASLLTGNMGADSIALGSGSGATADPLAQLAQSLLGTLTGNNTGTASPLGGMLETLT